jgi:hypothetical protein
MSRPSHEQVDIERRVRRMLTTGQYREAALAVHAFEYSQDDTIGTAYNGLFDEAVLAIAFSSLPEALAHIDSSALDNLRPAAALSVLFCRDAPRRAWVPRATETGTRYSIDTAAELMIKWIWEMKTRLMWREWEPQPVVFIIPATGEADCDACRQLHGIPYTVDSYPELPYAGCTSIHACRCSPSCRVVE